MSERQKIKRLDSLTGESAVLNQSFSSETDFYFGQVTPILLTVF